MITTGTNKSKCQSLGWVRLLATPWTVAHQAPLSMGILQARTLERVAIFFSRRSSQPRDWTHSPTLQVDFLLPEPPGKPTPRRNQHLQEPTPRRKTQQENPETWILSTWKAAVSHFHQGPEPLTSPLDPPTRHRMVGARFLPRQGAPC